MTADTRAYDNPTLTCENCPNIVAPEHVVSTPTGDEFWCHRCVHNHRLTTNEEQRWATRLIHRRKS